MDVELARFNMIEQQIRTWEVLDQTVLNLLAEIHREDFVPASYQGLAFADIRIPMEHGQSMMMPKEEARLLQSLHLNGGESILEIGSGSGYLTALLARSCRHVKSIDIHQDFIDESSRKLERYHIDNVDLETLDALKMLSQRRTYDVVVLTASLPRMDDRFFNLLNHNGKLFAIIGESPVMETTLFFKEVGDSLSAESLFETDLPVMIGAANVDTFVF